MSNFHIKNQVPKISFSHSLDFWFLSQIPKQPEFFSSLEQKCWPSFLKKKGRRKFFLVACLNTINGQMVPLGRKGRRRFSCLVEEWKTWPNELSRQGKGKKFLSWLVVSPLGRNFTRFFLSHLTRLCLSLVKVVHQPHQLSWPSLAHKESKANLFLPFSCLGRM